MRSFSFSRNTMISGLLISNVACAFVMAQEKKDDEHPTVEGTPFAVALSTKDAADAGVARLTGTFRKVVTALSEEEKQQLSAIIEEPVGGFCEEVILTGVSSKKQRDLVLKAISSYGVVDRTVITNKEGNAAYNLPTSDVTFLASTASPASPVLIIAEGADAGSRKFVIILTEALQKSERVPMPKVAGTVRTVVKRLTDAELESSRNVMGDPLIDGGWREVLELGSIAPSEALSSVIHELLRDAGISEKIILTGNGNYLWRLRSGKLSDLKRDSADKAPWE